jgi:hypothetical protein
MNLKIRRLGRALAITLALSALAASTAHAVEFHSSAAHTIISGTQKIGTNDIWSAGSGFGTITCENNFVTGTTSAETVSSWPLSHVRTGCKDSFGRAVDVDCVGVHRRTLTPLGSSHTGCEAGSRETITSGGKAVCTVTYAAQTNNGFTYKNLGGTNGVEITIHSTNVSSTIEGGFFNCGTSTTNGTAGTYDGVWVVTGKDTSGNAVELKVE